VLRWVTILAAATAALAPVGVSGCGDGDGGGPATAELARFAPTDALAFGQTVVRPEGDRRETIESILDRFPDGDQVGEKLIESLNESLAEDDLSYEDNIEPWLGEHAAGFITNLRIDSEGELRVGDDEAAVAIEVTDEDRALDEAVATAEAEGPVRESSYEGIEIFQGSAGDDPATFAVFDGALVAAAGPRAIRTAIDASRGDSLEGNQELDDFLEERQGESLAVGYADSAGMLEAFQRSGALSRAQVESLRETYGAAAEEPVLVGLDAEESKVTLDFASGPSEGAGLAAEESSLLEDVPGDSWVALGLGDVGGYVDSFVGQLGSLGTPGLSAASFDRMLRREVGVSLDDLRALGDAAAFGAGGSLLDLQAGAVFEAPAGAERDNLIAAMRRALARSGQARLRSLRIEDAEGFTAVPEGIPAPINFAARDDRLVIALGDAATEALLEGGDGSEAVDAARDELGGDDFAVGFLLRMEPVLDLVDNFVGDDDEFVEARRYLDQIASIAAGTRAEADESLFRLVVELTD
jgi:hypothetical protein